MNEGQIDLLLDMIKTADVTSEENQAENATLIELEGELCQDKISLYSCGFSIVY